MRRKRRRFTATFKKRVALEALRGDRTIQAIAAQHEVHPNQVSTWKRQAIEGLEEVFSGGGSKRPSEQQATIRDLHEKIGELTVERDFFCAGSSAESLATAEASQAQREIEFEPPVRVAGRGSVVAVLHASGRERTEPGIDATNCTWRIHSTTAGKWCVTCSAKERRWDAIESGG